MIEPAYYRLKEVEEIFRISRDTLTRWARAGLFELTGQNRGRRAMGESVRATYARAQAGEDLWLYVKRFEQAERQRMAKAPSIRTRKGGGGTSPRPPMENDSLASAPLTSKGPDWLKKIS